MSNAGTAGSVPQSDLSVERTVECESSRRWSAILLAVIFLNIGLFTTSNHEMWRDEMQAWLLARDSQSLAELFRNLKYEGCSGLWHVCLMGLSRVFPHAEAMQIFHLLIATGTVYLVMRYSPFSRLQNILFAFSYYSLFEYSVMCRNYALAVFLCVLFCVLISREKVPLPAVGVVLGLLCHTCVHGAIIAIAAFAWLLVDRLTNRGNVACSLPRFLTGMTFIGLGVVTAVLQMKPPADHGFAANWFVLIDEYRLASVYGSVARSYLPIPNPQLHFWNTHISELSPFSSQIQILLATGLLVTTGLLLRDSPRVLFFFLTATVGLLCFSYIKHSGGLRHDGFLFLVLLISIWMLPKVTHQNRPVSTLFTLLLGCQVVAGLIAVSIDYRYPFSGGKAMAMLLQQGPLREMPLVCEPDYCASSILGELTDTKAFFLRGKRVGSFTIWDTRRLEEVETSVPLPDTQIVAEAKAFSDDVVLVMNRPLEPALVLAHQMQMVSPRLQTIVADEQFYLYRFRRTALANEPTHQIGPLVHQ